MLAPCVAIVGPANSGKTSLLHLLDIALQTHTSRPLVYVVKGTPDHDGRYLLYSPDLREVLKPENKGRWAETTRTQVCQWIDHARTHLDLVLLDFGGRHDEANHVMLDRCTHYLVVARRFPENAEQEAREGMDSWRAVCERSGLRPVAFVESLRDRGEPEVNAPPGQPIHARFRSDACVIGDRTNLPIVEAINAALLALPRPSRPTRYVDLRLDRGWFPTDLANLGGQLPLIEQIARTQEPVVLGGRAPIWAYLASMHRALDANPETAIEVFDPKTAEGLVRIPKLLAGEGFPAGVLEATWSSKRPEGTPSLGAGYAQLSLQSTATDRFLPAAAAINLQSAPQPVPPVAPAASVAVFGKGPIWLHAAYSRWLRTLPGVRAVAIWDATFTTEIVVHSASGP